MNRIVVDCMTGQQSVLEVPDSPPPTLANWLEHYGLVPVGESLVHEAKSVHAIGMDCGLASDNPYNRFQVVASGNPSRWWVDGWRRACDKYGGWTQHRLAGKRGFKSHSRWLSAIADRQTTKPKPKLDWWSKKPRVEDDPEHYL